MSRGVARSKEKDTTGIGSVKEDVKSFPVEAYLDLMLVALEGNMPIDVSILSFF